MSLHRTPTPPAFITTPPPTPVLPLSLHDALPILPDPVGAAISVCRCFLISGHACSCGSVGAGKLRANQRATAGWKISRFIDRKSTRLNSSHLGISYAVFCLKKQTQTIYYGCLRND